MTSQNYQKSKLTTSNNIEKNNVKGLRTEVSSATPPPVAVSDYVAKAPSGVYLGMWTQGFWDEGSKTLHPEILKTFQNKIGKKVAIAHYYRGWDALASEEILSELTTIYQNGWRPMISANPYFFSRCQGNGLPLYKAIAQGNCDEFLHDVGKTLKQFGSPIFLRFAWEMNVPSMEWNVSRTGSTDQDFINAWRRVRNILYQEQATNVLFVFSPHIITSETIRISKLYPGDSFVDWIGLDGYNWGATQKWSSWQSFSDIFAASYYEITKIAPTKPLMIAEVNSTNDGGDKATWYTDMLTLQIPLHFPKIQALIFYNEDRSREENVNWSIDILPSSLSAFSKGIHNQVYLSHF